MGKRFVSPPKNVRTVSGYRDFSGGKATGDRVRGDAFGWGTAIQAGRSRVRFPMGSLKFFIALIIPRSRLSLLQK